MKSTMGSAGEFHDIPSMCGTAQYAGVEYAELLAIRRALLSHVAISGPDHA
jgi:hypothetical protein